MRFGSGRTFRASTRATRDSTPAPSHGIVKTLASSSSLPEKIRAEDGRAEDRADDGAAQHVGDPTRATVGRVHVTRGCADEKRHAARRPDQGEPNDHRSRLLRRGAEGGQPATDCAEHEPDHDHRDAPELVHRPASREGGQGRGREEDRRTKAEERLEAGHEDKRRSDETAATSWSTAELTAIVAPSRIVLRRIGRSAAAASARIRR